MTNPQPARKPHIHRAGRARRRRCRPRRGTERRQLRGRRRRCSRRRPPPARARSTTRRRPPPAAGPKAENTPAPIIEPSPSRTSVPGVYAAGDIASASHPHYGRTCGSSIGRTRALTRASRPEATAAGRRDPYTRLPYFFSDQFDLGLEYAGHARATTSWCAATSRTTLLQSDGIVSAANDRANVLGRRHDLNALVGASQAGRRSPPGDPSVALSPTWTGERGYDWSSTIGASNVFRLLAELGGLGQVRVLHGRVVGIEEGQYQAVSGSLRSRVMIERRRVALALGCVPFVGVWHSMIWMNSMPGLLRVGVVSCQPARPC